MAGVLVNEGTQTNIASDTVGTQQYQLVKLNVGAAGVDTLFTNTLGTLTNLGKGTVTRLEGGTLTALAAGTITQGTLGVVAAGTVATLGLRHTDEFATVVNTGTSVMGTIRGSVAGSAIYVTGLVISAGSATNVEIASGGTSTPILGTIYLNANGGVALTPINPPLRTASGSALVFKQSSAISPLSITCVGYID